MSLPGEETAKTIVEKLGDQPFMLSMVILNALLIGYLYYEGVKAHDERLEETRLLYENRKFVGELLANCYPQPRGMEDGNPRNEHHGDNRAGASTVSTP
jgi:hypothetical protein